MKDMFKLHVFPHTAFVVIIYYLFTKELHVVRRLEYGVWIFYHFRFGRK